MALIAAISHNDHDTDDYATIKWATSRENQSLGFCDQIRLKSDYSSTETSKSLCDF